jgi:hypothetical protein
MQNEKDVKRKVKAILDKHRWFWWMPPANAYGKGGVSDFIALKTGTFMGIETKFGTNKPTAMQIAFLNSVRAEDGFGFVVTDKNYEYLNQFLESFAIATAFQSRKEEVPQEHGSRMLNAIYMLTRY